MIEATITYSNTFINRPQIATFNLRENEIAMEKKNEQTGRFEKVSVGQLYKIYRDNCSYGFENEDGEEMLSPAFFEEWFYQKILVNFPYRDRILTQTFKIINDPN